MENNNNVLWKTTVIVSNSLQNKEIAVLLSGQQHLLRYSDSIEPGALVFPLSGAAFLLITPEEFPQKPGCDDLFNRIGKFIQVHRNSFLLLHAPAYGARELQLVSAVQKRFFGSNLKILPVHSNADVVKGMLTIAKVTSKPHVDSVRERMLLARTHIIEQSLETLKKVDIFKVV